MYLVWTWMCLTISELWLKACTHYWKELFFTWNSWWNPDKPTLLRFFVVVTAIELYSSVDFLTDWLLVKTYSYSYICFLVISAGFQLKAFPSTLHSFGAIQCGFFGGWPKFNHNGPLTTLHTRVFLFFLQCRFPDV